MLPPPPGRRRLDLAAAGVLLVVATDVLFLHSAEILLSNKLVHDR
jgi:hypothetical protein